MNECKAKKTIALGERTTVTVGCGLTEEHHLHVHMAQQVVDGVTVTFKWNGEFRA